MSREPLAIDLNGLFALATAVSGRRLIAIVGAPGSGKSTVAEGLIAQVNAVHPGGAAILPMDGYHFDDAVLDARGLRARKARARAPGRGIVGRVPPVSARANAGHSGIALGSWSARSEPHPRSAAVLVDELDAGRLEHAADRQPTINT